MAKSFIKNANNLVAIVGMTHQYVQNWSKAAAQKMIKEELIILPTAWGLQVGKYAVKHVGVLWKVYNAFDEIIETFSCKQSAVAYCILDQTNRLNMARELRRQDTKISKLMQDQINYSNTLAIAVRNTDKLTMDVITARMSESESLLTLARGDLDKTLQKAKYLKGIWE